MASPQHPHASPFEAIRHETEEGRELAATAYGAGVMTASDFSIFQDHG